MLYLLLDSHDSLRVHRLRRVLREVGSGFLPDSLGEPVIRPPRRRQRHRSSLPAPRPIPSWEGIMMKHVPSSSHGDRRSGALRLKVALAAAAAVSLGGAVAAANTAHADPAELSPGPGFRVLDTFTVAQGTQNYTCGIDGTWPS